MSQLERHAKQQALAAEEAAAYLRQRQALAPKPIAVLVVAAFGYFPQAWRSLETPLWLHYELGTLPRPRMSTLSFTREK